MAGGAARAVVDTAVTETDFQALVVDYAQLRGWRYYHAYDSRRSPSGFPDLVLVRDGVLVFAELKTEQGRVSRDQNEWLDALVLVGLEAKNVRVVVWRPSDWDRIVEVLQ